MHTIGADLALSLLYTSKALFHPVLDCIVSSSVISKPRRNEQKRLELPPGIEN